MKLLLITQKVDRTDPILGFFHRWIEALAERSEHVTVIGQSVGPHALPANVYVVSLGKERGASKVAQIVHFWHLLWSRRRYYDAVLVHMTPVWVVLGWAFWKFFRKPMYLWYEARGARWPLLVALRCVRKVFSASPAGMPLVTRKSVITGHGIDTEHFAPGQGDRDEELLVTVGRVTRAKRLDVIARCLTELPEAFRLRIVGAPITAEDRALLGELQGFIAEHHLSGRVAIAPCTQRELLPLLQRAGVFLHASETALDKALLEAMSSGCLVVSSSEAARAILPAQCIAAPGAMAQKVLEILSLSDREKEQLRHALRERVLREHSLAKLAERLVREMVME